MGGDQRSLLWKHTQSYQEEIQTCLHIKLQLGAGAIAQQLTAFTTLPDSGSEGFYALFW